MPEDDGAPQQGADKDLVERLGRLDACAVSDALDRLGQPGAVLGLRRMGTRATRLAGRVITVQVGPRRDHVAAPHLGSRAIMAAGPGDVVVMANSGRPDVSAWGGLLSLAASRRGLGGVVVDGACRDVDEAEELGFPVFARAAVTLTARGRIVEESFGEPVAVGPVRVATGDLVIADGSGVVFVAQERAEEVVSLAEAISDREAAMADALRTGESIVDVMHDDRFDQGGGRA